MHIAILLNSNDTSDFAKKHNTDDIKYIEMITPLRPDWQIDSFPVWRDEFPEDISVYDGVIMTGSPASVHDDEPWIAKLLDLIRKMYTQKIPMYGGCFGHQAIALALGGKVSYNFKGGWSIGKETTRFNANAPLGLGGRDMELYSIHKEEVTELPKGARSIGTNESCKYPAFVIDDHVLTTQYHPEMTESFLVDLTGELKGALPADQLAKAREEFQTGHEGGEFIKALITFFENAYAKPSTAK